MSGSLKQPSPRWIVCLLLSFWVPCQHISCDSLTRILSSVSEIHRLGKVEPFLRPYHRCPLFILLWRRGRLRILGGGACFVFSRHIQSKRKTTTTDNLRLVFLGGGLVKTMQKKVPMDTKKSKANEVITWVNLMDHGVVAHRSTSCTTAGTHSPTTTIYTHGFPVHIKTNHII